MTTERRTDARGKAGERVSFTDATSESPSEGELLDIGRGGMFVSTAKPLPVGKRIDFEVHGVGSATITGMARVVWARESTSGELPAGMGIKFIDVDNDALLAIDRLVGLKKNVRERTVLGIAAPTPPAAASAKTEPTTTPGKARERTMLGIAPPAPVVTSPPREKELSWPEEPPKAPLEPEPEPEQVEAVEPAAAPLPEPEPAKEPEPAVAVAVAAAQSETPKKKSEPSTPPPPRELPKRETGSRAWIIVLVLLVGAGVAVYFFRDKIFPGETPAPTATTASASASAPPLASVSALPVLEPLDAAPAIVEPEIDASATTIVDARIHDSGHDAGDGGKHHHDGGAAGATSAAHHAPTAKPKPSTSSTDNPY